jgi:hypothetical protein
MIEANKFGRHNHRSHTDWICSMYRQLSLTQIGSAVSILNFLLFDKFGCLKLQRNAMRRAAACRI